MNATGFPHYPGQPAGTAAGARGSELTPAPERLLALSAPAVEDLLHQLGSPTVTVLLADSQGCVLRAIGHEQDAANAESTTPAALAAPARAAGADGKGAQRPVLRRVPPRRIGIAAPILPPDGGMIGFVNADTSALDWLSHANALVQTAARIIEHRLIESETRGFLLLHFHRYADVLGTPLEALTLFDTEGGVLLSNRVATDLLAPSEVGYGVPVDSCFSTRWSGIVGHATRGPHPPFTLRDHRGLRYCAHASLSRNAA